MLLMRGQQTAVRAGEDVTEGLPRSPAGSPCVALRPRSWALPKQFPQKPARGWFEACAGGAPGTLLHMMLGDMRYSKCGGLGRATPGTGLAVQQPHRQPGGLPSAPGCSLGAGGGWRGLGKVQGQS